MSSPVTLFYFHRTVVVVLWVSCVADFDLYQTVRIWTGVAEYSHLFNYIGENYIEYINICTSCHWWLNIFACLKKNSFWLIFLIYLWSPLLFIVLRFHLANERSKDAEKTQNEKEREKKSFSPNHRNDHL